MALGFKAVSAKTTLTSASSAGRRRKMVAHFDDLRPSAATARTARRRSSRDSPVAFDRLPTGQTFDLQGQSDGAIRRVSGISATGSGPSRPPASRPRWAARQVHGHVTAIDDDGSVAARDDRLDAPPTPSCRR